MGRNTHVHGSPGKNIQLRNLDQEIHLIGKKRDEYEQRDIIRVQKEGNRNNTEREGMKMVLII